MNYFDEQEARPEGKASGGLRHAALSLGVMLLLVAIVFLFNVPNPNMILITGLAVFTSLYGFGSGAVCAAVMIVYSMYFFSTGHSFFAYTDVNLQKMGVIVLSVALNVLFIGNLKRQQNEAARKLREINALLERDNKTLEAASLQDALTGARNRYALRRDYEQFENRFVHVMMLDLDDFKNINDSFGHPMGDYVLKQVSSLLTGYFGKTSCYRYGGDEFLVISADQDELTFSDKMKELKVQMSQIEVSGHKEPVHFSAGYVYGDCKLTSDLRLMLHQADKCLYEAKRLGKDGFIGRAFVRE